LLDLFLGPCDGLSPLLRSLSLNEVSSNTGGGVQMSESSTKEAKIGFADLYEQFIVPTMSAQWAPRVVEAASILTGDRVLDVGCGTGVLAREAADRVGSDARVSGLDVNLDMLEIADALMAPFCLGDGEELLTLFRSAGIDDPKLHSHESWGRFPSVDEFVRIEVKGWVDGQLEGGMDEGDYTALVADARQQLEQFCTADGEALIPMNAHIVTAMKN
jgi:SAM-dependent methyltransferase